MFINYHGVEVISAARPRIDKTVEDACTHLFSLVYDIYLLEEVHRKTLYFLSGISLLKLNIACHYSPLIKSYTMMDKPKAQIET